MTLPCVARKNNKLEQYKIDDMGDQFKNSICLTGIPSDVLEYSVKYYKRSLGNESCPVSYDRKNTLKCESILT